MSLIFLEALTKTQIPYLRQPQRQSCSIWNTARFSGNPVIDAWGNDTDYLLRTLLRFILAAILLHNGWSKSLLILFSNLVLSSMQITTFAIACSIFTFTPTFRSPFVRPLRASLFGGFALSTLIPVVHGLILHGWEAQSYRASLGHLLGTLLFNTAGATAYACKVRQVPKDSM